LAKVSAQCGGIYTVHMRSEGDRIEAAVAETIAIAEASGAPAEIYHFKQAGKANWGKFDAVVAMIDAARARDANYREHVQLYRGRYRARCGDAVVGAGGRHAGVDRTAEGFGDTREGRR
jgi:hypothetical protein